MADHTPPVRDDLCTGHEAAPFCRGPSDPEGRGAPCETTERSARGYCPGEYGHEAERQATLEGGAPTEQATVAETTEPAPPPPDVLAATGTVDIGLGALATVMIVAGGALTRWATK